MADTKRSANAANAPAPPPHFNAYHEGLKRLWDSKAFSDVTVVCRGKTFKAHKTQLCAHSECFQKMLGGSFKEAQEGKIVLDDEHPQLIEALLHYFYHFDYEAPASGNGELAPIVFHVRMYAVADKYFVDPLKKLSAAKFEARALSDLSTPAFAEAVSLIYQTTIPNANAPIKQSALGAIASKAGVLLGDGKHAAFLKVLRQTPDLGADLAIRLTSGESAATAATVKRYRCPSCLGMLKLEGVSRAACLCGAHHPASMAFWVIHEVKQ